MAPTCPKCNSNRLFYVQKVYEYHAMESLPDEDGNCDLKSLEETIVDDNFHPFLHCDGCDTQFNLDLSLK